MTDRQSTDRGEPFHRQDNIHADLSGKKVTVVGLGRFGGGIGVTKWLCAQGAKVIVSDHASADTLVESVAALDGLDVVLHLGGHEKADFLEADLLVVSPAVRRDMPLLTEAQAAGVLRTSEINLFLAQCKAPVIGITGTVGKSTVTAMLGEILTRRFTVHVGGNIGKSLLKDLPSIAPEHLVVLELSSFQLDDMQLMRFSPHIALVTNLTPNHLDRHGTIEAYAEAKKNIFRFQSADDVLILNKSCPATSTWANQAPGKIEWFDPDAQPFELQVPGKHNQANAQAAWSIAKVLGVERTIATDALSNFAGLPHRLQFIGEFGGVRYFNDSKCTTPDGAIVAVRSFAPRQSIIILGGYDKGVSFDQLGAVLAKTAKAVIAIGTTKDIIANAVRCCRDCVGPIVKLADDLTAAVTIARNLASPGDVVLLSPACASYDMFTNYEQRGEAFTKLVKHLNA